MMDGEHEREAYIHYRKRRRGKRDRKSKRPRDYRVSDGKSIQPTANCLCELCSSVTCSEVSIQAINQNKLSPPASPCMMHVSRLLFTNTVGQDQTNTRSLQGVFHVCVFYVFQCSYTVYECNHIFITFKYN